MSDLAERFAEKYCPEPNTGCWLWTGSRFASGYGQIWLDGFLPRAHRVSWELHRGPIPDGMHVLHKCDTPACVNPEHLFLGTARDNARDRHEKKRSAVGERSGLSRLTAATVSEIRNRVANGEPKKALAREYGVDSKTVRDVVTRATWRHV